MKILALECSSVFASAAVSENGEILSYLFKNEGLTHSQTLLLMADEALKKANLKVSDIDGFCISTGPGSFTGVRIGVSALKGLSFGLDSSCVGVSTLLALAQNVLGQNCIVAATMDARCNQVYGALFSVNGEKIDRLSDDMAQSTEEFAEKINYYCDFYKKDAIIIGDGAKLFFEKQSAALNNARLGGEKVLYQNARGVIFAALEDFYSGNTVSSEDLLPTYLRLPQAERELKKKTGES